MFQNFPESGQEGAAGAAAAAAGQSADGALGAQIAGIVTSGLVGISNSALAWADAFCVTQSCKNKKKQIEADREISENQLQAAKYGFVGTALETKQGRDRLIIYSTIGVGALALAAYALTRRNV